MDLEKASEIYAHETVAHLPSKAEIRKMHRFSEAFRRNMAELMERLNQKDAEKRHRTRVISFGKTAQRFAAAILIFVVGFIAIGTSVDAIREPLFDMTKIIFKDHVELIPREYLEQYENEHMVGEALFQRYVDRLEEMGFEKVEEKLTSGHLSVQFEKDRRLFLHRYAFESESLVNVDYEKDEYKAFTYSGKKFQYSMKKHIVYWEEEDALYMILYEADEKSLLELIKELCR